MTDNELLLAISNMLDPIKEEIQEVRQDVQEVRQDVKELKTRVKKIELTQENEILPRLNTMEACYASTYEKYKKGVDDYEALKQDMSIVKKVVAEHSEKLQKIG